MEYVLYAIFFVSCLALVGSVLLQPGKTDAGALFTSNISSSAFAPRGTQTVLSKVTIVSATVFMLSALMLAMPALTGQRSVRSSNPEPAAETPAPEASPVAQPVAQPEANAPAANTLSVEVPSNTPSANTNSASNSAKPEAKKEDKKGDKKK